MSVVSRQDLQSFIQGAFQQPFAWGRCDCCTLAADWVWLATGRDPFADWRGAYGSGLAARRLLRRAGGLARLCRTGMAGFEETAEPRDGDVAVVEGAFEERKGAPWVAHAAALRFRGMWVVRTRRGMIANRAPLITTVTAWRVADRRVGPCRS